MPRKPKRARVRKPDYRERRALVWARQLILDDPSTYESQGGNQALRLIDQALTGEYPALLDNLPVEWQGVGPMLDHLEAKAFAVWEELKHRDQVNRLSVRELVQLRGTRRAARRDGRPLMRGEALIEFLSPDDDIPF